MQNGENKNMSNALTVSMNYGLLLGIKGEKIHENIFGLLLKEVHFE